MKHQTQTTQKTRTTKAVQCTMSPRDFQVSQGGITCGAIDEPRKSSKAINERVIINLRDTNVVIACFRNHTRSAVNCEADCHL